MLRKIEERVVNAFETWRIYMAIKLTNAYINIYECIILYYIILYYIILYYIILYYIILYYIILYIIYHIISWYPYMFIRICWFYRHFVLLNIWMDTVA